MESKYASKDIESTKIYLDVYFIERSKGLKEFMSATRANNELTRKKLARYDMATRAARPTKRDKEVIALWEQLRAEIEKNLTAEERQQQELLNAHESWLKRK